MPAARVVAAFAAGNSRARSWRTRARPVLDARNVLATTGFFSTPQLNSLSNLSKWAFLPAFAGVGLRTHLRDLVNQGWRPIVVGVLGEIFIALVTLGLVLAAYHYGAAR